MKDDTGIPTKLLILISLIQGLCLLFLHQSIEMKFWPHSSPQWLFAFYSMAFVGPIMMLLSFSSEQVTTQFKWIVPFTLLTGLLGYYVGYQANPLAHISYIRYFSPL